MSLHSQPTGMLQTAGATATPVALAFHHGSNYGKHFRRHTPLATTRPTRIDRAVDHASHASQISAVPQIGP